MKRVLKISSLLVFVLALVALAGCMPKDPEKAKAKLEKAGYSVTVDGTISPKVLNAIDGINGAKSVVSASKDDEHVSAVYFESAKLAKESYKAMKEQAANNGEKTEAKLSGKWIYYGTEAGVKAFK